MSHYEKHNHHGKHDEDDGPHAKVVGALIALTVVSIVMNALFAGAWWALIPQIVLLVHLIKAIILFIQEADLRKNYPYHTELDDVIKIWVALLIVSIIMNAIFWNGFWIAEIPKAVLRIKAVEITILFFVTMSRNRKMAENSAATVYVQPIYVQPGISVIQATEESAYSPTIRVKSPANNSVESARFCSNCGGSVDLEMQFCTNCGSQLRNY